MLKQTFKKLETMQHKKIFNVSFYNSLSLAFSEFFGSLYSCGVLEPMPSEAGKILFPYQTKNTDFLATINKMMQEKKSIDQILKIINKQILIGGYCFTGKEMKLSDSIWKKISSKILNTNKN